MTLATETDNIERTIATPCLDRDHVVTRLSAPDLATPAAFFEPKLSRALAAFEVPSRPSAIVRHVRIRHEGEIREPSQQYEPSARRLCPCRALPKILKQSRVLKTAALRINLCLLQKRLSLFPDRFKKNPISKRCKNNLRTWQRAHVCARGIWSGAESSVASQPRRPLCSLRDSAGSPYGLTASCATYSLLERSTTCVVLYRATLLMCAGGSARSAYCSTT